MLFQTKKKEGKEIGLDWSKTYIGTHHGKNHYLFLISGSVSVSLAFLGGGGGRPTYGIKTNFFENLNLLIDKYIA
jgi:hypothetical protein